MKTLLFISFFLVLAIPSYSQQIPPSKSPSIDYYHEKSRNQRVAGYTLLGLGTVAFTIPIIVWANSGFINTSDIESPAGPISMGIGLILIPTGASLLIASGVNKRKGMKLSFKNESAPYIQNSSISFKSVPSLTVQIGI